MIGQEQQPSVTNIYTVMRIETLDSSISPLCAALLLADEPCLCFLDSSGDGPRGRWSFVGVRPDFVIGHEVGVDFFDVLDGVLSDRAVTSSDGPPFGCGLMGYLSYDLCRDLEDVCGAAVDDLPTPRACFGFYDCVFAFDKVTGGAYICYLETAKRKVDDLRRKLAGSLPARAIVEPIGPGEVVDWSAVRRDISRDEYLGMVERVKDYIAAGDVYQINLSQRFSAPLETGGWELYQALRSVNPSPFGCYLDMPGLELASASPERLVRLDGRTREVETRPIKGTRPRGATPEEDLRLARELAASEKDRAENLMIVDMARNDLGRVCEYGSVIVPELWEIEEHPNVWQMVSTVRGTLAKERSVGDMLRALFPGGSITGAPKVRAMRLIDEIEPVRRGIYTGSVGYIDIRGNADFNICIRSVVIRDGRAWFQGGGGIVADSVPVQEYQETLDKVGGIVAAIDRAGGD